MTVEDLVVQMVVLMAPQIQMAPQTYSGLHLMTYLGLHLELPFYNHTHTEE